MKTTDVIDIFFKNQKCQIGLVTRDVKFFRLNKPFIA